MVLPVLHGLARRNPGAALRLLTHAPGDALVRADPAVAEVRRAERGQERAAVPGRAGPVPAGPRRQHHPLRRHRGRDQELAARVRRRTCGAPAARQPVTDRYLRILATST